MFLKNTCVTLLFCLLFLSSTVFAQAPQDPEDSTVLKTIKLASEATANNDFEKSASLLKEAQNSIDSTSSYQVLFNYYQNLATLAFDRYQIEEAQKSFLKSIDAATRLRDTASIVAAYSGMANALLVDNKFKKALVYQREALQMLESDKNDKYYSLLSNMAIAYKQASDFDNALVSLIEVKNYFKEKEALKSQAIVENNIGELYRENFKDYTKAKEHYKRAENLNLKINEKQALSQNYHNLSLLFEREDKLDSAFVYIGKAIKIKQESGDLGGLAISNHALGTIQIAAGEYDKAIASFQKSLEISTTYGITPGLYFANMGIGDALMAKGNKSEALEYYKKVENITTSMENFDMKKSITQTLLEYYKENNNYEKALEYSDRLRAIEDSVALIKNNDKLDELRIQYETNLAEAENKILREKEVAQEEQIKLQNYFLIGLILALVIFVVLVVVLFKANRQRKIAYKKVQKATKDLELQYQITKEREADLQRAVALKDKIFSVLGHDLRTPLANVSSLIDSMSQIDLSPEEMEFMLKHLKGETSASLKTLENILQWARLQMNDKSINVTELDEDGIIIEIIKNFESHTETKAIELSYVNTSKSVVWADENQFRSIANNLIANAIKFSPVKGQVEVRFSEEKDFFVFRVSDQGKGIDPSVIKNLETQQELMSTYGTEGEKGTGIGLRIVKDFINMHNGRIEFSKNDPSGTLVTVYLPKLIDKDNETNED
tara:strand:- start:42789 stop:44960 length:2172 start_codon:yes stop_codon:yes gene_type:complete